MNAERAGLAFAVLASVAAFAWWVWCGWDVRLPSLMVALSILLGVVVLPGGRD